MDKHLSYWQDIVDTEVFRGWHDNNQGHTNEIRDITRKIIDKEYKSILDCGAGLGKFYESIITNNVNIDYQGIDITEKFVHEAISAGIPMSVGDTENILFEDNSFDVCLAHDVLNHLYDYRPTLREMLRVAKKEVIVTFFKPSVERFYYLHPDVAKQTIGWYPGVWDPGNMPVSCPRAGFYPKRTNHCPVITLQKKYKIHKSPFGFYTHAHEDEHGEPVLLHHHFEMSKFFDFVREVAAENGEDYKIYYGGDKNTERTWRQWTKEPNTPALKYYANMIFIEKQGDC